MELVFNNHISKTKMEKFLLSPISIIIFGAINAVHMKNDYHFEKNKIFTMFSYLWSILYTILLHYVLNIKN